MTYPPQSHRRPAEMIAVSCDDHRIEAAASRRAKGQDRVCRPDDREGQSRRNGAGTTSGTAAGYGHLRVLRGVPGFGIQCPDGENQKNDGNGSEGEGHIDSLGGRGTIQTRHALIIVFRQAFSLSWAIK